MMARGNRLDKIVRSDNDREVCESTLEEEFGFGFADASCILEDEFPFPFADAPFAISFVEFPIEVAVFFLPGLS